MKTKFIKYICLGNVLFLVLAIIIGCVGMGSAFAESEAPDDLGYIISSDGKTLLGSTGNSTTANIPSGIETIAEGAFRNNEKLVNVRINSQTKVIKQNAFYGCTNLKNIVIPADSELKTVEYMAFARCETLREIALPSKLEAIGGFAFLACGQLQEIVLPESLTSIGEYAFLSCINVSKFSIPKNVKEIGKGAFNYCIKCNAIDTDNDNEDFSSQNGVLYNKDKTKLVRYPAAKSAKTYEVPSSVETVGYGAFWDNRILTEVKLLSREIVFEGYAVNDLVENTILTKLLVPKFEGEENADVFDETKIYRYCPNLIVSEY